MVALLLIFVRCPNAKGDIGKGTVMEAFAGILSSISVIVGACMWFMNIYLAIQSKQKDRPTDAIYHVLMAIAFGTLIVANS